MKDLSSIRARADLPPGMVATILRTEHRTEVVFVEAALLPGAAGITITGGRGREIEDQVRSAQSLVWSRAHELGIHTRLFRRYGLHIHAPLDDDYAAAGLAIVVALVSVYNGVAVAADLAIIGATTLTGLVLSVTGIDERLETARRAGFAKIIVPRVQHNDPAGSSAGEVKTTSLVFVDTVEDALNATLPRMMKHIAALKPTL